MNSWASHVTDVQLSLLMFKSLRNVLFVFFFKCVLNLKP